MAEEIVAGVAEGETAAGSLMGNGVERAVGAAAERIEFHDAGLEQAEVKYDKILSRVVAPALTHTPAGDATKDAQHLSEMTDEESKVQKLLDLAQTKGVAHAVKTARSLGDYYALDRMHDELAGKLYDGLISRGLIERE